MWLFKVERSLTAPARRASSADIGIKDGKIAKVEERQAQAERCQENLDAHGLVVAPGFVDLHTHYDAQINWDPYCTIVQLAWRNLDRDWQLRVRFRAVQAGTA